MKDVSLNQISSLRKHDSGTSILTNVTRGAGNFAWTFVATHFCNDPVITQAVDRSVTITCQTNGVNIYYTTDDSEPTTQSMKYTEPILLLQNDTIRAIVYLPARIASYFVTLLMASQFIGSLHFVFGERMYDVLFEVSGVNFSWHTVFGIIFYLIPLVIHILDAYKGELRVES